MNEHQMIVAKRNSHLTEKQFYKYLLRYGWTESEITEMWRYAKRRENEDKQTNLEWLKNRIQTMNAEEVSEMIYAKGPNTFCYGRDCLDYNSDCLACFRAWLEEEHNEL